MPIEIKHDNLLLAIIIPANYNKKGISFFTPNNFSQQLGYMNHPKGKIIDAHTHKKTVREIIYTQEVLFIKSGKVRVDFYDEQQAYIESYILEQGDTILLASGGHGFAILEDAEMIEVKQGPYNGDEDKTRLAAPLPSSIKIISNI